MYKYDDLFQKLKLFEVLIFSILLCCYLNTAAVLKRYGELFGVVGASLRGFRFQAELGLSEIHKELVLDFLKFSRYKRTQCLKDVESAFSDVVDSRLLEETFTSKELSECVCVAM